MDHDSESIDRRLNDMQSQLNALEKRLEATIEQQDAIAKSFPSLNGHFNEMNRPPIRPAVDNPQVHDENCGVDETAEPTRKEPTEVVAPAPTAERDDIPEWRKVMPISVEDALKEFKEVSNEIIEQRFREKQARLNSL